MRLRRGCAGEAVISRWRSCAGCWRGVFRIQWQPWAIAISFSMLKDFVTVGCALVGDGDGWLDEGVFGEMGMEAVQRVVKWGWWKRGGRSEG